MKLGTVLMGGNGQYSIVTKVADDRVFTLEFSFLGGKIAYIEEDWIVNERLGRDTVYAPGEGKVIIKALFLCKEIKDYRK
jgi:hypothetical protein